jgi:hypothetical protein
MREHVIARYSDGFAVPGRLDFSGQHVLKESGSGTRIDDFAVEWVDARGLVLLHVSFRPEAGVVALNSRLKPRWGRPQWGREQQAEYPFARDQRPFCVRCDVDEQRFRLLADGSPFAEFEHRADPRRIAIVRSTIFLWRLEPDGDAVAPEIVPVAQLPGGWVRAEANQTSPHPVDSFRLFAVLTTWMEEDVVEATVMNCFTQGCDRVYLVDNGSTDRTVERAVAVGATLARSYRTDRFDLETHRQAQSVVDEISGAERDAHIWWLWLDADEFHHGPRGLTLREYLATLDRRFRVVGTRFFDHRPTSTPANVRGRHPLDYQPLCLAWPPFLQWSCGYAHSNHPLQRWDRAGPRIVGGGGAHTASAPELLLEPAEGVLVHHFPYREEAATRRRLELLFGLHGGVDRVGADPGHSTQRLKLQSLDAVYAGRWQDAPTVPACAPGHGPRPKPFDQLVDHADAVAARWY